MARGKYCHHCRLGPWNLSLFDHCQNCGHELCGSCTSVRIPDTTKYSYAANQSGGNGQSVARRVYSASNGVQTTPSSSQRYHSSTSRPCSDHYELSANPYPELSSRSAFGMNGQAQFEAFESSTAHYYALPAPDIRLGPSDSRGCWSRPNSIVECCQCGEGGHLAATNPACSRCGHPLGDCCPSETVK